jgi:CelD/BcsL family acetyltransferase involved in cellulose biosynthesis
MNGSELLESSVELQLETSFDLPEKVQNEWDWLVLETGSDIYMSYDWCRNWWEVYGGNRQLQILLFRVEGRLTGVLPMLIDQVGMVLYRLRLARFLYTDMTRGIVIPVVKHEHAEAVYQSLIRYLIQDRRCDAISFNLLSGKYSGMDDLRRACKGLDEMVRVERDQAACDQSFFELPGSFDDYLSKLSGKERSNWRRRLRSLRRDHSVDMDVLKDAEAGLQELPNLKKMHDLYWRQRGQKGHFGDMPEAEVYLQRLIRAQAERGGLRIFRLKADDKVVAYQLCFSFGKWYHARLCARLSGEYWDRYSIGTHSLMQLVEAAIEEGAGQIESGPGHYDYKVQFGASEIPVHSFLVLSASQTSRRRWWIFRLLKYLFDTCYYKIWFYRLAPRLRLPRGPYWRLWLRMQV